MIRARGLAMAGACFALLAAYPGGGAGSLPATSVARPASSTGTITSTASRVAATTPTRTAAPATAFEGATTHVVTSRHSKNQTIDLQRRNGPLDVAPAVTGVSPNVGPSSGATSIGVVGSGFTGATDVFFGTTDVNVGTSCPNSNGCIVSVSDGEIDAQTPPESAGALDITVENDVSTSPVNAPADQFTWLDPPTVTNVDSPQNEGATGIAVTGNDFSVPGVGGDAVTDVELDPTGVGSTITLPACGSTGCFAFVDDSDLTINLPASVPPGQYDVRVITPGGTSNQSSNDFLVVRQADPTVSSVTPDAGPTAGGAPSVAIVGTDFEGSGFAATDVFFGATDVTTFALNGATSITVTPPSGSGQQDVRVETQSTDGTAQQTSNTSPADTYVYAPVPAVTSLSPSQGPTLGGNTVTLTGTGFESTNGTGANFAATRVTVGTTAITVTPCVGTPSAPCFTLNSGLSITVKDFPPHAAGTVNVTVITAGGTSTTGSGNQYNYVALPTVTSLSPSSGPPAGGNQVLVNGTGFATATDVFIDGTDITAFSANGPGTQITIAHFPSHAPGGPFDVTVENAVGTSATSSGDQYTYDAVPVVTNVAPDAGATSGGNSVTVTGTGMSGATDVQVGTTDITTSPCSGPGECFTVNGAGTQITIQDMPGGTANAFVDITVSTPGGTSNTVPADTYVYAPVPTVSGVSPSAGALAGGNTIMVTGSNFQSSNGPDADYGVTSVTIGGTAVTGTCPGAPCFTAVSDTQVNVQVPAESAGTVNVTVTTQGGTSGAGSYTYAPVPTISSISPLAGPVAGGTTVTINGAGFESGSAFTTTQVSVDGTPITGTCPGAPCFTVVGASQITVEVPANAGGTVPITVTTIGGTSAAVQYAYAPVPTVTGVSPNAGPLIGGTPVTITGTDFESTNGPGSNYAASSVMVGTATCPITTCFVVSSPTTINIASVPADLAGGIVDIRVTTLAGTSAITANDHYTYVTNFPTVTSLSPSSGAESGGAILTITGSNFGTQTAGFHATKVSFGSTNVTTTPCPTTPTSACFNVLQDSTIRVFTPSASAAGAVNVEVTNPAGTSTNQVPYTYVAPSTYTPIPVPFRICDTRPNMTKVGCAGSKTLTTNGAVTVRIATVVVGGESVPSNATAVVINLTAIDHSSSASFVTAYPAARPTASNINVDGGRVQANLAIVALSSGGMITVFNSIGSVDVLVDVEGYFAPPPGSGAGTFHPLSPVRICNTRASPTDTNCTTGALPAHSWRKVTVSGLPPGTTGVGIPSSTTAAAAVFNLTAVTPSASTFLAVTAPNSSDACPTAGAGSSNLNPNAGETEPNRVISTLGPHQDICVYNSVGSVNFIVDVSGWFGSGGEATLGADFYAVPPTRICDTRAHSGTQCTGAPSNASVRLIPVAGIKVTPAIGGAAAPVAVVANLTGISGTANTFLELYPADAPNRPGSSDLNPAAHDVIANLDIVALATSTTGLNIDGNVDLFNSVGSINIAIDIAGWFQ